MRRRSIWLAGCAALALAPAARAAGPEALTQDLDKTVQHTGAASRDLGIVAMPIPVSNPAIGTGLAAAAMALYTPAGSERPWTTGIGGVYTDRKSWGAGVFQRAYFGGDWLRLTAFAGTGDFNLDFYGVGPAAGDRGVSIPIEEKGDAIFAQGLIHIIDDFYLGPAALYLGVDTVIDVAGLLPFPDLAIPPLELDSQSGALGLAAEYDTRNAEYGPTGGVFITGQYMSFGDTFGGDFEFGQFKAAANAYVSLSEDTVIAGRVALCDTGDGAPFYQLCMFGQNNDLRGYPSGQYRDHSLLAGQVELRQHLFWRIGVAAFAGIGGVGDSIGGIEDPLAAGGLGLRFKASEEYGVNLSIDYAVGDNSDALYFYIGEAF